MASRLFEDPCFRLLISSTWLRHQLDLGERMREKINKCQSFLNLFLQYFPPHVNQEMGLLKKLILLFLSKIQSDCLVLVFMLWIESLVFKILFVIMLCITLMLGVYQSLILCLALGKHLHLYISINAI